MSKRRQQQYLLGDSRKEAARLRSQARLWDPVSKALFDRIGVRRGWRVLEIGPGQGSLHLELRRRVEGPVDAVEPSATFAKRQRRITSRDGLGAGRVWTCQLLDADLPTRHYDLIFARWVFLFLPDPIAHLRKLARALKRGGVLALQEYHRDSFVLIPRPDDWRRLIEAERAMYDASGADVNIGTQLPLMFRQAGLRSTAVVPTIMIGGRRSEVWRWLSDYYLGILDRYARQPPMDVSAARRLRRAWLEAERDRSALMIAPAVVDVVGRK
jgi:SAM-dependent methyltransferase